MTKTKQTIKETIEFLSTQLSELSMFEDNAITELKKQYVDEETFSRAVSNSLTLIKIKQDRYTQALQDQETNRAKELFQEINDLHFRQINLLYDLRHANYRIDQREEQLFSSIHIHSVCQKENITLKNPKK